MPPERHLSSNLDRIRQVNNVRFGSKADICAATSHVRFTPNSDRESEFPQRAMSALPPKADMCSALAHVGFGPRADMHERCLSKCSVLRVFTSLTFMPLAEPIL